MKRPAIFFDRDNTLMACDDYLGDPSKVVLVEGAPDAVARARELGFATVVFSNQSGVARGLFDEAAVHAVNQRLDEMLAEQNRKAVLDRHEFCPDHPEGMIEAYRRESTRRKPGPGMIQSAAEALALDLARSWVIGDAPRDIEAGAAAGCRTILFSDPKLSKSPAAVAEQKVRPDYCVTTLKEAMEFIEREGKSSNASEIPAKTEPTPHPDPLPKGEGAMPAVSTAKLEMLATEILREVKRQQTQSADDDFSVSKLLAGIVQVLVLAMLRR